MDAAPFAFGGKLSRTPSTKLINKRHLPPTCVAKNVGTEFAIVTFVEADNLVPVEDGVMDQLYQAAVSRADHLQPFNDSTIHPLNAPPHPFALKKKTR